MKRTAQKISTSMIWPRCYTAAKMIVFLFLLFIQMSCGSGAASSSLSGIDTAGVTTVSVVSTAVSTDSVIRIKFNNGVDPATISTGTCKITGPTGTVSGTITYDVASNTAIFTPFAALLPRSEYTATVSSEIKDLSGHPIGSQSPIRVTTGDDTLSSKVTETIPNSFFGLHIHYADTTTAWPSVPFGSWRLWDAYVAWPWLEPSKGSWDFSRLDKYLALAEQNHVEVLLPLGFTPTWASARPTEKIPYGVAGSPAEPANIEDWKTYVRKVATRYKGRIHYYEIWNEPNLKMFYTGSVATMVNLTQAAYQIIKEVDPTAQLVSPSATGNVNGVEWMDQFFSLGGATYTDVIGYHFYVSPNPPEAMVDLVSKVKQTMSKYNLSGKQLWNTEAGWYVENHLNTVTGSGIFSKVLSDKEASSYVLRSLILNWATGVSRDFWYSWDNKQMGLIEADGKTVKPPAQAYGETLAWLSGAKIISCGKNSQGIWIAQISRQNSSQGWIVWTESKNTNLIIPAEWNAKGVKNLDGSSTSLQDTSYLTITPYPVLIEQ